MHSDSVSLQEAPSKEVFATVKQATTGAAANVAGETPQSLCRWQGPSTQVGPKAYDPDDCRFAEVVSIARAYSF